MGCCVSIHGERGSATSKRIRKVLVPSVPEETRIDTDHRVIVKLLNDKSSNSVPPSPNSLALDSEDITFHDALPGLGSKSGESLDDFFSVRGDFTPSGDYASRASICIIGSPPLVGASYPRRDLCPTSELVGLFQAPEPTPLSVTSDFMRKPFSNEDDPKILRLFLDPIWNKQLDDCNNIGSTKKEVQLADFFRDSQWIKEAVSVNHKPTSYSIRHRRTLTC